MTTNDASLFPRNFKKEFPVAVRGEGSWIIASDGRRFLDAAGQAAVVSIGHGVKEIGQAMAAQSSQLAFAHTSQFHSAPAEKLAARLLAMAPQNFRNGGRVYFTSGGSEATETAIKLVRQYYLETDQPERFRIVSRNQSYHGSTLGAMSVSGNVARRAPYAPLLQEWGHVAPCFPYHGTRDDNPSAYGLEAANDLDKFLGAPDAHTVAAFIFEPVVGATLGAAVPPPNYVPRIAEICRQHKILLIADEVMTGMGRTGKPFAVQHWQVEPDIILVGKGIASGYAPLGAVIVAPHVAQAFKRGTGAFQHGFTYQAHPVATAAGNAVFDYLETNRLFAKVSPAGEQLKKSLTEALTHPNVGDVRGLGLLLGVEFVQDKSARAPFPKADNIAERIRQAAQSEGVLTYPTQGCVDGYRGDHILLAPPFNLTPEESAKIVTALKASVTQVFSHS